MALLSSRVIVVQYLLGFVFASARVGIESPESRHCCILRDETCKWMLALSCKSKREVISCDYGDIEKFQYMGREFTSQQNLFAVRGARCRLTIPIFEEYYVM